MERTLRFLFGIVLIALTVAGGVEAQEKVGAGAQAANFGEVVGVVTDSVTQEPLQGAAIILDSTDLGAPSDAEGHYRIKKVPPGAYTMTVRFIGYEATSRRIDVSAGKSTRVDVRLRVWTYRCADLAKQELAEGIVVLWVGGLVISPIPDSSFTDKYGFRYVLIGCDPTGEKEHNEVVEKYLDARNGEGWYERLMSEWHAYVQEQERKLENK